MTRKKNHRQNFKVKYCPKGGDKISWTDSVMKYCPGQYFIKKKCLQAIFDMKLCTMDYISWQT